MDRKIIHVDMDAFYASVEQRDQPHLRGKPICVGGSPSGRGVVTSPSYEARAFGVRSAMPSHRVRALCPEAIFVRPRMEVYVDVSKKLRRIFREVSHLVEPLSLDEAYLDVTENRLGEPSATRLAMYLRSRIKGQLQLNASAGVGPNKFIAKVASDLCKPNGMLVVSPDEVAEFVRELPVERLWGVGPKTAQKMHRLGMRTTRDIRQRDLTDLHRLFGKWAPRLFRLARGEDDRPVSPYRQAKSVGAESTFSQDLSRPEDLSQKLKALTERLEARLEKKQLRGTTLTLKIRFRNFETVTRATTVPAPVGHSQELFKLAWKLLEPKHLKAPVRLLGLSMKNFPVPERQLTFKFEEAHEAQTTE